MKPILCLLFLGVLISCEHRPKLFNVASIDLAAVQSAVNNAANGDTVTVPAGTATWTGTLTVNKDITLKGAGIGVSIINDAVPNDPLIKWDYSKLTNGKPRLTGFEFRDGGRTGGYWLHLTGNYASRFRWDNCKVDDLSGIIWTQDVFGVFDSNKITGSEKTQFPIRVNNSNYPGGPDGSWRDTAQAGTDKFLYLENCGFTRTGNIVSVADGYNGARLWVRHCRLDHYNLQMHGTDTGSYPNGGGRVLGADHNTLIGDPSRRDVAFHRGGTAIFHDNIIEGYPPDAAFTFHYYRASNDFVAQAFRGADGVNDFDQNEATPFFTSTAETAATGTVVTVASASFTPNQWFGYTIRNLSKEQSGRPLFSSITANTANTITYKKASFNIPLTFAAGDRLEIRQVINALDMPGMGRRTFIGRTNGVPTITAPSDQEIEPCYEWNNGNVHFKPSDFVVEKTHFNNSTQMPEYTPFPYPHPLRGEGTSPVPTASATSAPQSPTPAPSPTPTNTPPPTPPPSSPSPTDIPLPTATPAPTTVPSSTPTATSPPSPSETPVLPAPTNLVARVIRGKDIELRWADNSSNEIGFEIQRTEGNCVDLPSSVRTSRATTLWTDTSTVKKVNYCYRVRALGAGGTYSEWSEVVTIIP